MIPERIQQIAKTSAIACALVGLCILVSNLAAGVTYLVASAWIIANFLVWAVVFRIALHPGEDSPGGTPVLVLALLGKVTLLGGGIVALIKFAPYSRVQLYAILAGVSSVLIVAFLKALGSRVVNQEKVSAASVESEKAAKV